MCVGFRRRRLLVQCVIELWPGLSSPTALPASNPRTNVVTYCSLTSSPSSVRHSTRIAARVPFSNPS